VNATDTESCERFTGIDACAADLFRNHSLGQSCDPVDVTSQVVTVTYRPRVVHVTRVSFVLVRMRHGLLFAFNLDLVKQHATVR